MRSLPQYVLGVTTLNHFACFYFTLVQNKDRKKSRKNNTIELNGGPVITELIIIFQREGVGRESTKRPPTAEKLLNVIIQPLRFDHLNNECPNPTRARYLSLLLYCPSSSSNITPVRVSIDNIWFIGFKDFSRVLCENNLGFFCLFVWVNSTKNCT